MGQLNLLKDLTTIYLLFNADTHLVLRNLLRLSTHKKNKHLNFINNRLFRALDFRMSKMGDWDFESMAVTRKNRWVSFEFSTFRFFDTQAKYTTAVDNAAICKKINYAGIRSQLITRSLFQIAKATLTYKF